MDIVAVDKLIKVIDLKIQKAINAIHTTSLGKIVKYDPVEMRADVELLENIHFKGKFYKSPIIVGCLVAFERCGVFYQRVPYSEGDKVVVGFCESAIDEIILDGKNRNQVVSRRHSEDDAVVLKGWKTEKDTKLLSTNSKDWLLVNEGNGAKVVFKESGELEIDNGTKVTIGTDGVITTDANTINAVNATVNCLNLNASNTITAPIGQIEAVTSTNVSSMTVAATTSMAVAGKEMDQHVHGGGSLPTGLTDIPQ